MTRTSTLPILRVDGGGLLFARPQPNPGELEKARITAEGLVAAYNLMGYDAVGVSRLDLGGGLDFPTGLVRGAHFTWLSANLLDPKSGQPIFTPFISRKLGETRVAIIGITSDQGGMAGLSPEAVTIKPWAEVLTPLVAKLNRNHDFLILLTDLPAGVCGTLAGQFPAINLIINSGGDAVNQPPRILAPSSMLVATGQQGKYAGSLEVNWRRGGHWSEEESRSPGLPEKQAEPLAFFTNRFQAMNATVGEEPGVAAIVAQIHRRLAELGQKEVAARSGAESSPLPDFTGWRVCASCHQKAAARWQNTRHAGAYATLEKKNRQFAVDCLLCHVTGSALVSTDRLASLPPELRGVGCEVCHGPGRRHTEGKEKSRPRRVPEDLCRNCHVPEHDGHFDYARDVEMIRCDR